MRAFCAVQTGVGCLWNENMVCLGRWSDFDNMEGRIQDLKQYSSIQRGAGHDQDDSGLRLCLCCFLLPIFTSDRVL